MEQEKLYVIEEKTYEAHIDEEVHLYGLLHQLAFLAGKIKDRRDMENLIDTARRYGEIADQIGLALRDEVADLEAAGIAAISHEKTINPDMSAALVESIIKEYAL